LALTQWVADNQQTLKISKNSDIYELNKEGVLNSEEWLNYVGIPMLIGNQLVGVLQIIIGSASKEIKDDIIKTLEDFSKLAAAVISTIKYCDTAIAKLVVTKLVNRVNRVINSSLNFNEVYQAFADELKHLVDFDRMCFAIHLPETNEILIYAVTGDDRTFLERGSRLSVEGTAMKCILTEHKEAYFIKDLEQHHKFIEDKELMRAGMSSLMRIPYQLIESVDEALYRAKATGRNRVVAAPIL